MAEAPLPLLVVLAMPSFTTFLRNSEIRSATESIVNGQVHIADFGQFSVRFFTMLP